MFFITDDLRVMLGFPGDLVQILLNCGIKNVSRIAEQFSFIEPNVKESTQKGGTIRVKMMQRKSEGKIVVAEASENFIDVLFSFLTIPLDSVLELVLAAEGFLSPFYRCPHVFPNIRSRDPPEFHYCYSFNAGHKVIESSVVNKRLDPKSQKPSSSNSWGYVEKNSFVVTDDLV
ncbi:hypothetical protein V6N12_019817 [Hibiscus sabdariffa]|uniref:Uncharacterized protein n=1 Tax=Hibiscus sabdariffa TaxID=183260 RepID=A0ABR2ARS5_9ROSI